MSAPFPLHVAGPPPRPLMLDPAFAASAMLSAGGGLLPAGYGPPMVAGLGSPELVEIAPRHFLQCIRLPNGLFQPVSNFVLQAVPIVGKSQDDEPRVRRPQNSFLLFSNEFRGKLRAANKDLTNADVSRMLGEQWKNLPEEEKRKYRDRAEKIRTDFQAKHPDFSYAAKPKKPALTPPGPIGAMPMSFPMMAQPSPVCVAPPMPVLPPSLSVSMPAKRPAEMPPPAAASLQTKKPKLTPPVEQPAPISPPMPLAPPVQLAPPQPAAPAAAAPPQRQRSPSISVPHPGSNANSPAASTPEVQLLPYMLGDDDEDEVERPFGGKIIKPGKDDFWSFVDEEEKPGEKRGPSLNFFVPEGAVELMPETDAPSKAPAMQLFVNPNKFPGGGMATNIPNFLAKFNAPDPFDPLAPLVVDDIGPFAPIGAPLPPLGRR